MLLVFQRQNKLIMRSRLAPYVLCLLMSAVTISFTKSFTNSTSSIVQAQPIDSPKQQADLQLEAGYFQLEQSSLLAAQTKFQEALRLYQTINDTLGQRNATIGLATVDYRLGNYRGAQNKLQQASRLGNYNDRDGRLLSLRGLIWLELGDYGRALPDLQTGVHYLQVYGDRDRLGLKELNQARIALGEVYIYQGQYQQALVTLQAVERVSGDFHLKRRALNGIGTVNLELGQYEQALEIYQQAHNLPSPVGDRIGQAKTLANLGRAYRALGNKKQALKQYQLASDELRSIGAWGAQILVLNNLGRLALDLGLSNRALEYLQEAEGRLSSTGVGRVTTLINLGYYFSEKQDYNRALDYLQQALAWARQNRDRSGEAKALSGLGAIELRSGKLEAATSTLKSSIEVFESLRPGLRDEEKISLFETQQYTYGLLQQAYVTQSQYPEALTASERGRARAFIELLAQRISSDSKLEQNPQPPTLNEIKNLAQSRQVTLVNYSIIEDDKQQESKLYIWVINPQGEIEFRQLDLDIIQEEFKTTLAHVSDNARQAAAGGLDLRQPRLQDFVVSFRGEVGAEAPRRPKLSFSRDAYKLLIQPISDLLPSNPQDKVIFIPQESLFLIPFPALQNDEGEFLIEKHTLQIAPSIQTLALKQPSQTALDTSNALIVGNPDPMPQSLSNLPGTAAEAKTIAQILNVSPLVGKAATEIAVKQRISQAKLIHLATHGLFNEQQGMQSSLALATTEDTDGFLTAEEILDLKLQAELVVLSACNTGRGKITGDGVVGLSRSFLSAGASGAIVTLWYIPDIPTSELMTEFYRNLEQNPDKAQSLRQAMLTMMDKSPHPRDWAGFILVGY